jgi:hypothetical protein
MLLELEKYEEDIFQQAMIFWYDLDNESHVNISNDNKLIYRELERMSLFLNGCIGRFYSFFCKMQLDMNRIILIF